MKATLFTILFPLFLFISTTTIGQNNKSVLVENVPQHLVWPMVYKTFSDLNLKYPYTNKKQGERETAFFQYNTLLAKNRAKYKIVYENSLLTIYLFNRQYLSKNSWVDNPLPISKKQVVKLLKPIKEHIQNLLTNKNWTSKYTSKKVIANHTNQTPKGVFKDFAIAKTNNKEVNLLSFHENGNFVGIGLSEDKLKVQSLILQENENGEKVTMLFDDDGYPKSIITTNHILNISKSTNTEAKVAIFKTDGTFLKDDVLQLTDFETFNSTIKINNNVNGPSIFEINHTTDTENLSKALGYASTAISAVTCAASLTTIIGAIPACGMLLLDVIQRVSDEDAFYYDELELINDVIGVIPFKNPLKNYKTAKELIENIGHLVDGMEYVLEGSTNIYNKIFPPGALTIIGPDTIKTGAFGEPSENPLSFFVKSNYPGKIEFRSVFGKDMDIEPIDIKQNEVLKNAEENIIQFNVFGKITGITEHYLEASQMIDGERITAKKKIKFIKPNYYHFPKPNCEELFKKKIITKPELEDCLSNEKKCKKELWEKGNYYVSDDLSKITDFNKANFYLKLKMEDGTKYSNAEYGTFRSFVKVAPCMVDWSGIEDKRQIIILVKEALLKIEAVENKIKSLQKVANQNNYQKIALDVQELENSIAPIKTECTEKAKKIAQKRTIKYSTSKSDKEESSKNYNLNGAEVMDFRWGKYGGPNIEIEIFFSPIRTFKTIDRYNIISKFQYDLKQFSFSFEDGSEKPTKYALIIGDKIRNESKVKTAIRIKLFEKEIKRFNFYSSRARSTKIE